jgi:hypothetical protein
MHNTKILAVVSNHQPNLGRNGASATDVTFGRALKIWWSFVWRATVLMLPVIIVAMVIAVSILPFPKAGQPADIRLQAVSAG